MFSSKPDPTKKIGPTEEMAGSPGNARGSWSARPCGSWSCTRAGRRPYPYRWAWAGSPTIRRIAEVTEQVERAAEAVGKRYFGDVVVADRATNFFVKGIEAWLEENRARLG